MTIALKLGHFATHTAYADLPSKAVDHAAMMIASTLASAAAGYGIESSRIVRDLVVGQGGNAEASVWFHRGVNLPAANAGRVNALMSDAAASDDSDLRMIVHLGTQLTAAALALAERLGSGGKDVLAAMVLGYEVAGRIGAAVTPALRDRGFHGCVVAIFGAAAAAGCMLRLDERRMAQAIAIAAVSMGGLGTAADTSVAREYFAGNAAMLGVNAALAAEKGYVVEERIFETRNGFFDVYGGKDVESVLQDWGSEWDIVTDMAIKLVPGGHPYHAIAEAAANAAREGNVSADEVETITMTKPLNPKIRIARLREPSHPENLVEVAHTPAYFAAAAVADKSFTWVHASEEKFLDPVINALIDKVRVGEPPTDKEGRFRHGAIVTIRTKDGRSYTGTVYAPRGSGVLGIAWEDVDEKYRTLVSLRGCSREQIERSIEVIHNFRDVGNVADLIALLQ